MKTTPENITKLEHGQIFVFGSNTAGIHGKGAARTAFTLFGAQRGIAEGPTGFCYAIPTRIYIGRTPEKWRVTFEPVPLVDIGRAIYRFVAYAEQNPHLEFLVTKLGCGHAGYTAQDIKHFFYEKPFNVTIPIEFQ